MKFYHSFLNMIKNSIKSFDLFGHPIELQIKKDNEYHTFLGILSSIGILTLIFYSFLSLLIDMINRTNPSVLQNIEYQANPEEYKLNQDSFLFYLAITDEFGRPITQEDNQLIYQSKFSFCQRKVNEKNSFQSDCSTFLMKKCDTMSINSQILEKLNISAAVLKASLCFDPDEWNTIELSLQGTSQSLDFKGLKFNIEKCNNITSGGNCASQEFIDQKLSSGYLGFFISDSVLNQKKAQNPFSLVSKLITTTISSYQYKSMILQMRKSKLYNKENFFYYFENNAEYSALLFDRQSEWVLNTQKEELVVIHVILDDREVLYYRTYNNILDILGQMGGLLELMLLLVGLFVKPFNKLSCDLFLASKIFYFEQSNNQQKLYPQPFIGLGQVEGLVNQSQFAQLKKFFKLKAQQIKLFVHQYLFTCGKDRQLIQQSIESIYNQIDIIFIFNKLIEIDKLKKILLNDDQQILFNYIHKPIIQLDQRENMSCNQNLYNQNKLSFEEEITQALNSYNVIKENNNKKHENKTIMNLLDKDIQFILDQHENNKLQKESSLKEASFNDLSIQENRVDI
ncbi:unnamed protein product [Paramecium sonneborni]|uniref:Transmembrane protein n=1 Tax=Paramecium sonneborni TaxID=65129 RepID=A0A8S1QF04_9CILI|nr:unnamed protein product [Paramecium sonneborni]